MVIENIAENNSEETVSPISNTGNTYAWANNYNTNKNLINQIPTPEGFTRVALPKGSFGDWLRHVPLKSKGSKVYKNTSWDLVDAAKEKGFDIDKVAEHNLPEVFHGKNSEEKLALIKAQEKERKAIKVQMNLLNRQREAYVALKKAEATGESVGQLDDVIISAIVKQAEQKFFKFEESIN